MNKLDDSGRSSEKTQNARDHLANERTLLAWIRTSIGIMAFGFVVAKFSLFVKQFAILTGNEEPVSQGGLSFLIGIVLVGVGSFVVILSSIRYKRTERQLLTGSYHPSSIFIFILIAIVFVISLLLIYYLFDSINFPLSL